MLSALFYRKGIMAKRDQMTCPESATKSVAEMGEGQSPIFFRWRHYRIRVAFLKENHIFIVMSLSCNAQIVIKALDAWHLGHSKHYFSVIHYRGRGQPPHADPDFQFLKWSVLKHWFWQHLPTLCQIAFVPPLPSRDTSPSNKWQPICLWPGHKTL